MECPVFSTVTGKAGLGYPENETANLPISKDRHEHVSPLIRIAQADETGHRRTFGEKAHFRRRHRARLITQSKIALSEQIHQPLKEFYLLAGNLPQFMSAYEQFARPDQIYRDDDLLIFLEENQGVYGWGTDDRVYVVLRDHLGNSYDTELSIDQFLVFMRYFQVTGSGERPYPVTLPPEELLAALENEGWRKVADHNGIVVHCRDGILIWYYVYAQGGFISGSQAFASYVEIPDETRKRFAATS